MIVFPASGASSRFKSAGVDTPKFMLEFQGHTTFDAVLDGYGEYRHSEAFVVVTRKEHGVFFTKALSRHGIRKPIMVLEEPPFISAAATVYKGLHNLPTTLRQPMVIAMADVIRTDPYNLMPDDNHKTVVMDVYRQKGNVSKNLQVNWKNAAGIKGTGHYYFSSAEDYLNAFNLPQAQQIRAQFGEKVTEVAQAWTLFHRLKEKGYRLIFRQIDGKYVHDFGTPEKYQRLAAKLKLE